MLDDSCGVEIIGQNLGGIFHGICCLVDFTSRILYHCKQYQVTRWFGFQACQVIWLKIQRDEEILHHLQQFGGSPRIAG